MIRVSIPILVFIYLAVLLATVFGAWLLHEWRRQRRENRAFRNILRCALCGFMFEETSEALLPACPRCGSANERVPASRL